MSTLYTNLPGEYCLHHAVTLGVDAARSRLQSRPQLSYDFHALTIFGRVEDHSEEDTIWKLKLNK